MKDMQEIIVIIQTVLNIKEKHKMWAHCKLRANLIAIWQSLRVSLDQFHWKRLSYSCET